MLGDDLDAATLKHLDEESQSETNSFAPPSDAKAINHVLQSFQQKALSQQRPVSTISRIHDGCSTAWNSRLGRVDNARFLEHFRYIIVASQLLNEHLDQGSLPPAGVSGFGLDGSLGESALSSVSSSLYGAAATAAVAFAVVCLIHWARSGSDGVTSKSRVVFAFLVLVVVAVVGYTAFRRQWLKFLRRHAVTEVNSLTANWQAFEVSASSAMSIIQEVELVSKGYRLSTPLPPASRVEDSAGSRRCGRLRRQLHKAYASVVPACIEACDFLRSVISEDGAEKYLEVYDISIADVKDALSPNTTTVLDDDPESLKSLRLLSYRTSVLRRVTLCSLMSLEADGGKPDIARWRLATATITTLSHSVGTAAELLQQCLGDMDTIAHPLQPLSPKFTNASARDKMRSQIRKISMLSSGIRSLQAKMQILREETKRSMETSPDNDLSDLGPSLMTQYEAIGVDLRDLMQAWEEGKTSLQTNISKQHNHQEQRASTTSSSLHRSPLSSMSGLTAVEEEERHRDIGSGGPADALKALTGSASSRSSTAATLSSDEELVFEAVALPTRARSTLTREERLVRMQEERERQASARVSRSANTSMLRELESVINLRAGMGRKGLENAKGAGVRIMSL